MKKTASVRHKGFCCRLWVVRGHGANDSEQKQTSHPTVGSVHILHIKVLKKEPIQLSLFCGAEEATGWWILPGWWGSQWFCQCSPTPYWGWLSNEEEWWQHPVAAPQPPGVWEPKSSGPKSCFEPIQQCFQPDEQAQTFIRHLCSVPPPTHYKRNPTRMQIRWAWLKLWSGRKFSEPYRQFGSPSDGGKKRQLSHICSRFIEHQEWRQWLWNIVLIIMNHKDCGCAPPPVSVFEHYSEDQP